MLAPHLNMRLSPVLVTLSFLAACASGDGADASQTCPRSCPATSLTIILGVRAAMGGGAVSGAEATLSGPATERMRCELSGTATTCTWGEGPVVPGDYALQVTAPGFQPVNTSASVTVTSGCCVLGALEPSSVTLSRL
jgi:hypothetical protein